MFQNARIVSVGTDAVKYHACKDAFKRGDPGCPISPSALKIFDQCPSRWIANYVPPQSKPKEWGQMFDTMILTPELFDKRYIPHPETYEDSKGAIKPWTRISKTCRKWEEERISSGVEILDEDMAAECSAAKWRFFNRIEIARFISESQKQVLVSGEWLEQETGIVVPVTCLIDLVPDKDGEFPHSLGDIKSTRNASTRAFSNYAYEMSYHVQAAFDIDLFNAATGEERNTWAFLCVENFKPFEPAKKILSQDALEEGRVEVHRILRNYAICLKTGSWPSYDGQGESVQGWGIVRLPPWAKNADGQRFEMPDEEADEMPEESMPC